MSDQQVIRVGIIGLGGFAGQHQDVVFALEKEGVCKLVCTCDPMTQSFADRMTDLEFDKRGVRVYDHYVPMLDECQDQMDCVIIPTPIPLHAEMHRTCVGRGLPVYLEKPPTLYYPELLQMLEVEKSAEKLTNVAFNYIVEPERQALKRRILDGEFGDIREISFVGLWPRRLSYFGESNWKGRLMFEGTPLMESCFGNAMSHYVHNVLFWAGTKELFHWASVDTVKAELYHAYDIESADTLFVQSNTDNGITLRFAMSVACSVSEPGVERVVTDRAVIEYRVGSHYRIEFSDGRVETGEQVRATVRDNLAAYFSYLNGRSDHPVTRLEDCKPFVELNDLVFAAAGKIHTLPDSYLQRQDIDGEEQVSINGIGDAASEFVAKGCFPSEQQTGWGQAGGTAAISDLQKLDQIIDELAARSREA